MSIYGNLFVQESNTTFSLESLDNLLSEDINFEAMINESCKINILTEAIDMKTIKEKIKKAWDIIVEKINELLKKIKELIIYIKNKIINVFAKKNKEDAKKVIEQNKDSKPLDSEITVPNYGEILKEMEREKKSIEDLIDFFEREDYETCEEKIDEFDEEEKSSDDKSTVKISTSDDATDWLEDNVVNNNYAEKLEKHVEISKEFIEKLKTVAKKAEDIQSSEENPENGEQTKSSKKIKVTSKLISKIAGEVKKTKEYIESYIRDSVKVIRSYDSHKYDEYED